jgi:hypothetical protein
MQVNCPHETRWGAPFLQGKIIGIFTHAFGAHCWADDVCRYDAANPFAELKLYPSDKTIKNELDRLRYDRMVASERLLKDKVDRRTADLRRANEKIEQYSVTLEQKVAERTDRLVKLNEQLHAEIEIRKEIEAKKEKLINALQKSLREVKVLRGLLPICACCKKIRDDKGYWNQIESYILAHSEAEFSHSICPECARKLYPDFHPKAESKSKKKPSS